MWAKLLIAVGVLVTTGALAAAVVMWRGSAGKQARAQQQPQTIVSPTKGSLVGQKLSSTQTPSQFPGGIEITLRGEAEMLLTDPSGRRTGLDPVSKQALAEIPDASAGDDSIDDPNDNSDNPINIQAKKLEISPVVTGTYTLTVSSATRGTYDLELASISPKYQGSHVELKDVQIEAGARHVYLFKADAANGGSLQLSGGFGTDDVQNKNDRLLTYASPVSNEVELSPGTRTCSLVIFYDSRIRADSFSAVLDGQKVTNVFHPVPGGFEKVDIPLHSGRNLLLVTISGTISASINSEHDQIAFSIPNMQQSIK